MSKKANSKLRPLYVQKFFYERTDEEHGASLKELSDYLLSNGIECDRKTLYQDIEMLRDAFGLDIIQDRHGTVNYRLASRSFEQHELKLLVDLICASRFITHKKSVELIKKIEQLASIHSRADLRRQVFVDGRIKSMNESIYRSVDTIHTSINTAKQVSFKYCSYNRDKKLVPRHDGKLYTVNPMGLLWSDGNYYLIAYNDERNDLNNYRVDRMISVAMTELPLSEQAAELHFDLVDYGSRQFSMYGGEKEKLTLVFDNELVGVVLDRFGTDVALVPSGEERFSINVSVEVSTSFFGWLFQFGVKASIAHPASAAEKYRDFLKHTLAQYE